MRKQQGTNIIRSFLFAWVTFFLGVLMAVLFQGEKAGIGSISFVGFFLSLGSFIFLLIRFVPLQNVVKARYPTSDSNERLVLGCLFYAARGLFLLFGLYFLGLSFVSADRSEKSMVDIKGQITSIQVLGESNPSLKIKLDGNSNEFGINTYLIPAEKLAKIKQDLRPGVSVHITIERGDENKANDRYIQIYGIRTGDLDYLTIQEYRELDSSNNSFGRYLGIAVTGFGLIYLLLGVLTLRRYSR